MNMSIMIGIDDPAVTSICEGCIQILENTINLNQTHYIATKLGINIKL